MADLLAELRRTGETVPAKVMRDIRAAKTMIEILKVNQSRSENLLRIEEYLNNVESYLVPAAKSRFGTEYVEEWMNKIVEAQKSVQAWEPKPPKRFPVGIPRDKRWVRIEPSEEIPIEKIKHLSKELGLKNKTQEDGYVLVYGEEDKVKEFVKKTAKIFHKTRK
ncbi:MAG: DUF2096 family protein [Candidatus Bathyarchaeota archaeon]|nr:DUF2096 family protein [Candidatus Bathyarchaeota archaeon]